VILLNPGPVTLSPAVRAALGRADWCHREPEFAALTRDLNRRLAGIYEDLAGSYESVLLTSSGSGAVEAMLASFAPDDTGTLVVANGVYGERMARMLAAHRKPHRLLGQDWTAAPDLAAIRMALAGDAGLTHLAVVHHETTTGRLNDLEAIGALCRERGVALLLDAVSSFGAERIAGADWNLEAVAATANKCLHGAPGAAFVLARREAWQGAARQAGSLYLDLRGYHAGQHGEGFSPFTQAVPAFFALDQALLELKAAGGWAARGALYRARAARVHALLEGLGVQPLLPVADYASALRSYRLPAGTGYPALHDLLKHAGFVIYAGQGQLASTVFRLAFMGEIGNPDLDRLCTLLSRALGPS
jgi:2-aminoethylphosphonate-pyruvate transaminase